MESKFRQFIEWLSDNFWVMFWFIWMLSALGDLGGIMFDVKHDDKETRVTVETPIEKKEEGPKPTF